jgi:hypothetical protein
LNKDKVQEQHRRESQRRAQRGGWEYRSYGPRNSQTRIEKAYDKIVEKNAYDAFDWWFAKKSEEEVRQWWEATGKPWENPKLSWAQRWHVRYYADSAFHMQEKARLYIKKMRRKRNIVTLNDGTASDVLLTDARSCLYCGAKFDGARKPTLDHLIPLSKGGTHSAANLVVCCLSCNSRKGKRDFLEFVQTLPDPHRARSLRAWRKLRGAPPQQQSFI